MQLPNAFRGILADISGLILDRVFNMQNAKTFTSSIAQLLALRRPFPAGVKSVDQHTVMLPAEASGQRKYRLRRRRAGPSINWY
jgi:hypothetical protein